MNKISSAAASAVTMRSAIDSDMPAIMSSWLKSYRSSPVARHLSNEVYFSEHKRLIMTLLQRCGAAVAEIQDCDGEIAGWLCASRPTPESIVVHYCYTFSLYRKLGVARALLEHFGWRPKTPIVATHITHVYTEWIQRRPGMKSRYPVINNPYLIGHTHENHHLGAPDPSSCSLPRRFVERDSDPGQDVGLGLY